MLRINVSDADKAVIEWERLHHPHPRVQERMWTVSLTLRGDSRNEVADFLGIDPDTVLAHLKLYDDNGLEGLRTLNFYRPESDLVAHASTIEPHYRDHPPAT